MRSLALTLAGGLGLISLGLLAVSLALAGDLADWALPGLAALAAIGANVMLMIADRLRGRGASAARPG
jgi:hypothetical protein